MRYQAIRGQSREWLIVDTKGNPPRVICTCQGWYANPDHICNALNAYDGALNKIIEDTGVTITNVPL